MSRPGDLKVIQREDELDRRIYDGRLTAIAFLHDVRQDDLVEASWTVTGTNPVFGGRFASSHALGWEVPVAAMSLRVLWPAGRTVAWRVHGLEATPAQSVHDGLTEVRFTRAAVDPVRAESDLPPGVDAFPWVEFSEWSGWQDVVGWALPLYQPGPPSQALLFQVEAWRRLPDEAARARAALRFVEDEVRYMGFELGAGSHRPTPPAVVLQRRFGDCKDKSLLLASLLRALGMEASPALVNTDDQEAIGDRLPSPNAFDHVVVRARIGGQVRWLEPTRSLERGPIEALNPPPYRLALLLEAGQTQLTPLPAPVGSPLRVSTSLLVRAFGQPADLTVVTHYEGLQAVGMRHELSDTPAAELQRRYLDHLSVERPGIEVAAPLLVEDAQDADRITLTERYRVPGIRSGDDHDFSADAIRGLLQPPATTRRRLPLRVRHPVEVVEQVRVELPGRPLLAPEHRTVVGSAARLIRSARLEGNAYLVDLEYRSLRSRVEPPEVAQHLADAKAMRDMAGFGLTLAVAAPKGPPGGWGEFLLVILGLIGLLGGLLLANAAFNGDLTRWWRALKNLRRRRAFAAKFREAAGHSPQVPIGVARLEEVWTKDLALRCQCGAVAHPASCTMEAMVLGGRPLHVLQAPCAGCGSARRTYFVVDDRR